MFENDVVATVLVLVVPMVVLFALPFVMAWMEQSLDHEPMTVARARADLGRAWSRLRG